MTYFSPSSKERETLCGEWAISVCEKEFWNRKLEFVVLGFRPSWDVGKGENRR
jgi:hypothetical protein